MSKHNHISRRSFIRNIAASPFLRYASAAGASTLMSSQVSAANCPAAQRKSLVCIFLQGGADSFNFVIPGGNDYDRYASVRGQLAVPSDQLLGASDSQNGEFSFNRALPNLHNLYQNDRLAVVANLGPLIRPTSKDQYIDDNQLPQDLFAHDSQRKLWQTGGGDLAQAFGWGGSMAELLKSCNSAASVTTATSVKGSSIWLNNLQENYTTLNPNSDIKLLDGHRSNSRTKNILEQILAQEQNATSIRGAVSTVISNAITSSTGFSAALEANPLRDFSPRNSFEQQLHLVARLIAAREQLNMNRQIFYVNLDGWDTHQTQRSRFADLVPELDAALGKFQATIDDLGKANSVTSFTSSDFGRTLTNNGDGTDHGWGGHAFVMGGAVNGGRMYGEFPSFATVDNPDDAGTRNGLFAGRYIPKISVSQYGATIAKWMGLSPLEVDMTMPNINNFSVKDLGFLNS